MRWSHANGPPDNCTHDAPDHPGTAIAIPMRMVLMEVGEGPDAIQTPPMPGETELPPFCAKESSSGGVGTPCGELPEDSYCLQSESVLTAISKNIDNDGIEISSTEDAAGNDVLSFEWLGSPFVCRGNESLFKKMILVSRPLEIPEITYVKALQDFYSGGGTISLVGTEKGGLEIEVAPGNNKIDIFGMPSTGLVPSWFAFDMDDNGTLDVGARGFGTIQMDLGDGDDVVSIDDSVLDFLPNSTPGTLLELNGGSGADTVDVYAQDTLTFGNLTVNLGLRYDNDEATYLLNLNSAQDSMVDISGSSWSKLTFSGTSENDVINGNGGKGTGLPFDIPLVLSGGAGNDKLTGGLKGDTLKGGGGANDNCNGGKGRDKATGCERKSKIP